MPLYLLDIWIVIGYNNNKTRTVFIVLSSLN